MLGKLPTLPFACFFVFCACPVNTKLGTHVLYSSRSARTDPEVKMSKVKVTRYENLHGARLLVHDGLL